LSVRKYINVMVRIVWNKINLYFSFIII
jgi:hypothetical protein